MITEMSPSRGHQGAVEVISLQSDHARFLRGILQRDCKVEQEHCEMPQREGHGPNEKDPKP